MKKLILDNVMETSEPDGLHSLRLQTGHQRARLRLPSQYICLGHCLTLVQGGEERKRDQTATLRSLIDSLDPTERTNAHTPPTGKSVGSGREVKSVGKILLEKKGETPLPL